MIHYIAECTSTNTLLASMADAPHGTCVACHTQTAGRGQRGNTWEAEPGKNLTFSILMRPRTIMAAAQFEISEIVAIAIADVLRRRLATDEVRIKWPNDIYYRDSKICGILIENTLCGSNIERSIAGIGINVNQQGFLSDAPNPISMVNISGEEYELEPLLKEFVEEILTRLDAYEAAQNPASLTDEYFSRLWRAEGFWPYHDNLRDCPIRARIVGIAPTGHLILLTDSNERLTFAFKEVTAIL